ncbi:hypothetical protein Pmani_030919 [Petrolisthes manimaculis]|uniref:Uncharacterized protein n=1 Tax=Petrolisthes manimaculis TaxID=1843537 RepID=A0AAE1TVE5_9EUCA|nr:hypothetical protein Pmani_030919 [Petrolisthes manimaculis]
MMQKSLKFQLKTRCCTSPTSLVAVGCLVNVREAVGGGPDPQAASSFSGELDSVRVGSHRSAPPVPALLPSLDSHPPHNPNPGTLW